MRNSDGMINILITIIIMAVVFILSIKFINKRAPSISNNEINRQIYQVKVLKFNSTFNQSLMMLKSKNIKLCGQNLSYGEITKGFSGLMNAQMINNSAIKLMDGTIIEFKKTKAENSKNCFDIQVDFNGHKKPNTLGTDIHIFTVNQLNAGNFRIKPAGI